jgi:hypothetical protein
MPANCVCPHNIMGHARLAPRMSMDEPTARRVMLACAIETADTQGRLVSEVERDQIDRQARQAAGVGGDLSVTVQPEHFLDLRAQRVLAAVSGRNPQLAALQQPAAWQRWFAIATPVAALLLGVLTDVIANPHRVDLVSLPLLGILAWNLAIYLVLIGSRLVARRGEVQPLLAGLGRWTDGERALRRGVGNLRTHVTALFHLRWYPATQALHAQRIKRVLHLSAAAWAVGVALSLLTRGLVVEYRVGWESTFLSPVQVHAILSFLRLPALLLFPFQPFSVQEVAGLQFSQGGGALAGARWVYMYVALLLVVVVAPRLLLAAAAYWRERVLSHNVAIDLQDPYYQRLVSLLHSARVQLCLVTHREEDRARLMRVLIQDAESGSTLIRSAHDDVLSLVDVSGMPAPVSAPAAAASAAANWGQRVLAALREKKGPVAPEDSALAAAREHSDVVLHVVGGAEDAANAKPLLEWLGKPALVLVNGLASSVGQLPFDNFARCWVQEKVLLDAIGSWLGPAKAGGFARIAAAWDERNTTRFSRSMAAVAGHLLFAARQVEEVRSGALTVRNLMPTERQAQAEARQQAIAAITNRLDQSATEMFARLRQLHGVDETAAGSLQLKLEDRFVVQQSIDTPQAGMAGAATGAAMGASVDLLVGGLTLGAATALGALVGGSAAFIAAAWKNRASPSGGTLVQLSDEMMQAMVEAALLRYLAVAHYGRGPAGADADLRPCWKAKVMAAVETRKDLLIPFWGMVRTQPDPGKLTLALARELETIAGNVLAALYPPASGKPAN